MTQLEPAHLSKLIATAAALTVALVISACSGACANGPPIVERAVPETQRDELRVAVRNDLVPHCGKCHQSTLETSKPAALAVFDLDKPAWTSTMSEEQLRALPTRLPMTFETASRERVSALIGAELAARAPAHSAPETSPSTSSSP